MFSNQSFSCENGKQAGPTSALNLMFPTISQTAISLTATSLLLYPGWIMHLFRWNISVALVSLSTRNTQYITSTSLMFCINLIFKIYIYIYFRYTYMYISKNFIVRNCTSLFHYYPILHVKVILTIFINTTYN